MDYEPIIEAFAVAARQFCAWVEQDRDEAGTSVLEAAQLVGKLFAGATSLPGVSDEVISPLPDLPDVGTAAIQAARSRLASLPFQYYWEIFHAVTTEPEEPVCGDILEDLTDIYKDVKEGLILFENGQRPLAVWFWRSTFGMHWGRHAASALKALYDHDSR